MSIKPIGDEESSASNPEGDSATARCRNNSIQPFVTWNKVTLEHFVNCNWSYEYMLVLSICKCMHLCVCVHTRTFGSSLRFMVVGWGLRGMTLTLHVEGTDRLHLPSRVIMRDTNVQWCFLPPGIRDPSIRLCQSARLTRLKLPVRTFQSLGVGWGMLKLMD